ncbi:MAG: DUF2854 domain-containing protein [Symploca sp. SIO2G7]|nr:DUF2854 domain-containing protein [Symploca sp. SIO2G7]
MLPRTSLGTLGLVIGGLLTFMGVIAYATDQATLNLVGFFYGIPLFLGSLALKVSELKPVNFSQPTTPAIEQLRKSQATPTQNQIREDVMRYRYGQQAHLDESLERLGLSPTKEERPVLKSLRETEVDGAYTLVLEFASPLIDLEIWQQRRERIERFFGPGIRVDLTQPEEDQVDVAMTVATQ